MTNHKMNKFEMILGNETLKINDHVKFTTNWRTDEFAHVNKWAIEDQFLDDSHKFKIIHVFNDEMLQIKSIENDHVQIIHPACVERINIETKKVAQTRDKPTDGDRVSLKKGWESKTKFSAIKDLRSVYENGILHIIDQNWNKEFGLYFTIQCQSKDPNGIWTGLIEQDLIQHYNENS